MGYLGSPDETTVLGALVNWAAIDGMVLVVIGYVNQIFVTNDHKTLIVEVRPSATSCSPCSYTSSLMSLD